MKRDLIADAIGYLDCDLLAEHLERKIKLKNKLRSRRTSKIVKWSSIAASFALLIAGFFAVYHAFGRHENSTTPYIVPPTTESVRFDCEWVISVDDKRYIPESDLSENTTLENVGDYIGDVAFDGKVLNGICCYAYLPDDGETNRIVVPYEGKFYVYSFYSYIPDETANWPVRLLDNASSIVIRNPDLGVDEITYTDPDEIDGIIEFFSDLKEKSTQKEINQYCVDKFADQFNAGEIWIDEDGHVSDGGNITVRCKYNDLVIGECRKIIVRMKDNTQLTYRYLEGAGIIKCGDFGYILTEQQIETIYSLVGLK